MRRGEWSVGCIRLPTTALHCPPLLATAHHCHCSPLLATATARHLLLTTHCSLHTPHHAQLPAHCTLHTAHCTLLTTHCSLHTSLYLESGFDEGELLPLVC